MVSSSMLVLCRPETSHRMSQLGYLMRWETCLLYTRQVHFQHFNSMHELHFLPSSWTDLKGNPEKDSSLCYTLFSNICCCCCCVVVVKHCAVTSMAELSRSTQQPHLSHAGILFAWANTALICKSAQFAYISFFVLFEDDC